MAFSVVSEMEGSMLGSLSTSNLRSPGSKRARETERGNIHYFSFTFLMDLKTLKPHGNMQQDYYKLKLLKHFIVRVNSIEIKLKSN